ncbi:MAG TPA: ThiF family adenylyltransferase [bacterium]|nr:ThiF family adenylyltransferase [bacterium]
MTDQRYDRQVLFSGLGEKGQAMLARASAVQVGCGALGSTNAACLVRAGVGRYTIIDRDTVEISNLARQFLFDEDDAAQRSKKALAAAAKLGRANSTVKVAGIAEELNAQNVDRLLSGHDLVIDATDNMEARFVINAWCIAHNIPWIYGGIAGSCGMTMVILPGAGPCLCCLFPDPDACAGALTTQIAGVINTAPALIAALQSTEALKILTRSAEIITDFRLIDLWTGEWQRIPVKRDPKCKCCGGGKVASSK